MLNINIQVSIMFSTCDIIELRKPYTLSEDALGPLLFPSFLHLHPPSFVYLLFPLPTFLSCPYTLSLLLTLPSPQQAYGTHPHMVLHRSWSVKWRNTNTNRYIVVPTCFTCGSSTHYRGLIGGGAKQLVGGVMSI